MQRRIFLYCHVRARPIVIRRIRNKNAPQVRCTLKPIREVWIYDEAFAASRLSMMRIMARRTNAATVIA